MSHIYYAAKEDFLDGTYSPDTLKVALVEDLGSATESAAAPVFGDLIGVASDGAAEIVPNLSVTATTNGVLQASPTTFANIDGKDGTPGTTAFDWIVIVNDSGTLASAKCICAINGFGTVGQTGGDIVVNWDTSTPMNGRTGGIFAL